MAKTKGENEVEVPPSAVEPKPWFRERPSDSVIRAIKEHIKETGDVLSCNCNTHNRPDRNSQIMYVGEFELPDKYIKKKLFAPCPVCTSRHRKFGSGKIAWFPEEGVVRLIGPDCFKSLNEIAHEEAEKQYRLDLRRRSDVRYLVGNAEQIRSMGTILADALLVARDLDHFGEQLRKTTDTSLAMGLWNSVRTGELRVWAKRRELVGRTGEVVENSEAVVYARLAGVRLLNPSLKSYTKEIENAITALSRLDDIEGWRKAVAEMSDQDRYTACRILNQTVKATKRLFEEMRELQKFVEPVNINTLNAWGSREDCDRPTFASRSGSVITIGRRPDARISVPIPAHMEDELPEVTAPLLKHVERQEEEEGAMSLAG